MTITEADHDAGTQIANTDRAQSHVCTVCGRTPAKYTCPRCTRRTCQLECVKAHKASGCSGERDRAGFVGMHQYGDIGMWRDLAFLREIGDVVGQHGQELAASLARRSKLEQQAQHRQNRLQGRDQHGGHDRPARVLDLPQKDLRLRGQLGRRGIEVLFLPREMERHKKNRSNWNPKKQSLFLTVSAIVIDGTGQRHEAGTSHQHSLQSSLKTVLLACTATNSVDLSTHVVLLRLPARPIVFSSTSKEPIIPASEAKAKEALNKALEEEEMAKPLPMPHSSLPSRPNWTEAAPAPDTTHVETAVVLTKANTEEAPHTTPATAHAKRYWRIERPLTDTLESALCGTVILEWPEFELWSLDLFEQELRAGTIEIMDKRSYNRNKKHGRADETQEDDDRRSQQDHERAHPSSSPSDSSVSSSESEDDGYNEADKPVTADAAGDSDIDGVPI